MTAPFPRLSVSCWTWSLTLVVLAGIFPQSAAGQAGTAERILAYDVAIVVHPEATVDVEETIAREAIAVVPVNERTSKPKRQRWLR